MAQRYILRLETSTGNVYGDGDILLGNADDLLRPADAGKPWVKTDEYIESATPDGYEPIERSKYYGIMKCPTCGDPYTLPIKPLEFDVADALHPSASEFSRPALPSTILSQSFPTDVLYNVGDHLYITSAFSFHNKLVIEPNKYGGASRVFYGNLDISEALQRNDIAARHYFPYCPFCPSLYTAGTGEVFLRDDLLGRQGIVKYYLSLKTEQLIFYKDDAVGTQARDPIDLQEETSDRVSIFGQVKMEVVNKDDDGYITLNCTTSYYTSSGVLLASFDWTAHNPVRNILELGLVPHEETTYMPGDIPNIIIPGTRIHHLSVTTEPIDIESVFPRETCPSFLDGNGLATVWDITKTWANKYKQDKLTAGDNITITDNVISATAGAPTALTRDEVTAICNNIYGANNG